MNKVKNKKSNPFNQEKTTSNDLFTLRDDIILDMLELEILLLRIEKCTLAFQKRLDFPSDIEIAEIAIDNTKALMNKLNNLLSGDLSASERKNFFDKEKNKLPGTLNTLSNAGISYSGILDIARDTIIKINPYDQQEQTATMLETACKYLLSAGIGYDTLANTERMQFLFAKNDLTMKGHQAIGYWTKELQQKKQGAINVKSRTTKKEDHKTKLKDWMKTMKPKDCRLRAQKEFGVTERTVLKWQQEIRDEETATLRKKDDTA